MKALEIEKVMGCFPGFVGIEGCPGGDGLSCHCGKGQRSQGGYNQESYSAYLKSR